MKTYKNLIRLFALLVIVGLSSCSDDDFTVVNPRATTTLSLSTNDALVLTKDMEGQTALTLNWTEPDFGYNAAPEYQLVFNLAGGTDDTAIKVNVGNVLDKTFLVEELNKIVNDSGALTGLANDIIIKVQALVGKTSVAESDLATISVTSYATILDLSSTWGLVGSATPNGWDGPDLPFYKTSIGNVFVAYVTLVDGEVKIRENNDWAVNYGDNGGDGSLEQDGANIAVSAGTYKITYNLNDLTYTIEPFTWGLVGSATVNGWDGPDMPMTYDSTSDQWRALVTLANGELKIRLNNDWALNYGDSEFPGTLGQDGANIPVTAGNYLVTVNFATLEYTIESIDIWGLVGSATPNGWDGPDVQFTPNYANEGVWVLENVTLVEGEIKFRTNNDWGLNYGDDDADGTLEQDGANIAISAGTYSITLDFSNENNLIYTIN